MNQSRPICASSSYRAVFLSPHWDDAVFSCGGHIAQLVREGKVLVLNFFTNCPAGLIRGVTTNSEERALEEQAAAASLGFESITLDERDAPFRDPGYRAPSNLFGDLLPSDLKRLSELTARLKEILSQISFDALYIPLGVGWHVDHRLVFYASRHWWRQPNTLFYEDSPYRMVAHATAYRLREIGFVEGILPTAGGSWWEAWRAGWTLAGKEPIQRIRWLPVRWVVGIAVGIFLARQMVRHRKRWRSQNWGEMPLAPHSVDISGTFPLKTAAAFHYASQVKEFFHSREDWWAQHHAFGKKIIVERYWRMESAPTGDMDQANPTALSIVMVTDDFLPANTGAGVHVQKMALELVRRGHKIFVLTSRRSGQAELETWNGVQVCRFLSLPAYGLSQALPSRAAIRRILSENTIDIIHFHYLGFLMLQALLVARSMRMRTVYTAHMSINLITQPFFMAPWKKLLTNLYLRLCEEFDDIICVSSQQARQIQQFNIRSRVHMISNPIDFIGNESSGVAQSRRFVVLYAGRLSPEKNLDYLVRGFALLMKTRPDAELWIAGKGIQEGRLRHEATALGIAHNVSFLGHVPHEDLPALYSAASVFVLPSLSETQGMVALEAMCFRRAVIVTNRIVSAKELVDDGKNGFIVDPDSDRDLADKLVRLYDDRSLCHLMGEEGFAKSRGATSESVGAQLEQVYTRQSVAVAGSTSTSLVHAKENFRIERRDTCVLCGAGTFDDSAGNTALRSSSRSFEDEFFAVWRCPVCLSIHSLPKVPLDEYYRKTPVLKMRMNIYIRKGFENFQGILERQGVGPQSRILICSAYSKSLKDFFESRGYTHIEELQELLMQENVAAQPAAPLDAVVLADYLEMVDDPRLVLAWVSSQLVPGGLLLVNTPNAKFIALPQQCMHVLYQPYRIHILSSTALIGLAQAQGFRTKILWRHHYLDTLWPFANYRAMNYVSAFLDESEESAFEFRPVQMFRKLWLIPWFMCLGLFGGLFPNRSNMLAVFDKGTDHDAGRGK